MKKILIALACIANVLVANATNDDMMTQNPQTKYLMKDLKIGNEGASCVLSDDLVLTLISPRLSSIYLEAVNAIGERVEYEQIYSSYSQVARSFVYKIKLHNAPSELMINGMSVGICK